MTIVKSTSLACVALVLGFGLGVHAGSTPGTEEQTVDVAQVHHVAVFVRDIEQTARMYAELFGTEIPQFNEPRSRMVFPPDVNWDPDSHPRYGHIQLQNATIELQEGVGGESRWSDFLAEHGQGVEHLGFLVPDVPAALARFQEAGGRLIMGGCDGCTAHVDMREQLGYVVELIPMR